jgi:serine phosphatase RsbU (regulator of sigma subunit)
MKSVNLWKLISYWGVTDDMPVSTRKSTILFNQIMRVIALFMFFASFVFYHILSMHYLAVVFWVCLAFIALSFRLAYKGKVFWSIQLLSNLFPVVFLLASIHARLHHEADSIMLYLAPRLIIMIFTILPVAFLGFCDTRRAILGSATGLTVYLGFDYWHYLAGVNFFEIPYIKEHYLLFTGALTGTYFIILLLIIFLQRINLAYEKIVNDQKNEMIQQKDEIEAQLDKIEEQKNEIETQRNQLFVHNKKTTDSIQYASRIQSAALPSKTEVDTILPQNFTLFLPRDIVSGDFYFMKEDEDHKIIALADCTGHGVPGAFMSMLGIAFLNEIVARNENHSPDVILNALRYKVMTFLGIDKAGHQNKDGMDIALCVIEKKTQKLYFSGANNDVFILRNGVLTELKGDKMPIGVFVKDYKDFHYQTFDLQPNDMVYLATDGFEDQFGGEHNEKFKVKRFRDLLHAIESKDLPEQKEVLYDSFLRWKGKREQIDDVTVIGFRI